MFPISSTRNNFYTISIILNNLEGKIEYLQPPFKNINYPKDSQVKAEMGTMVLRHVILHVDAWRIPIIVMTPLDDKNSVKSWAIKIYNFAA